ncbi:MAG: hypothetical protein DHS20C08_21930 [Rhodomicrobium sp.]|nr:MAG: hypothetical protein DHS20C08_21930 [Rhodomicrobium sp.]
MDKFFEGSALWTIIRLVIISLIVGVVLATFNLDAFDLIQKLRELIRYFYSFGFEALRGAFEYFLVGAVIVFPIWIILRLVSVAGNKNDGGK